MEAPHMRPPGMEQYNGQFMEHGNPVDVPSMTPPPQGWMNSQYGGPSHMFQSMKEGGTKGHPNLSTPIKGQESGKGSKKGKAKNGSFLPGNKGGKQAEAEESLQKEESKGASDPKGKGGSQMKESGTILRYRPDKAFGFIQPDNGEKEIFVHITAFADEEEPKAGYKVTYDKKASNKGLQAMNCSVISRDILPQSSPVQKEEAKESRNPAAKGSGNGKGSNTGKNSPAYKTRLCLSFENTGECRSGQKCVFAPREIGTTTLRENTVDRNSGG